MRSEFISVIEREGKVRTLIRWRSELDCRESVEVRIDSARYCQIIIFHHHDS